MFRIQLNEMRTDISTHFMLNVKFLLLLVLLLFGAKKYYKKDLKTNAKTATGRSIMKWDIKCGRLYATNYDKSLMNPIFEFAERGEV